MKSPGCCNGKVKHPDKATAVIVLKKIKNSGLNAYKCPNCRQWHLGTSQNPFRVQARFDQVLSRHAKRIKTLEPAP